ncbi:MAG: MBL fold metallo-hydrolase, partial [Verrucomicrobia bacterium]|nr:MBL fold metallo-hydrolase [Verrucomicrobiota bacterium]
SSGMMTEKTLSNQLATRFIDNPQQSIYFVGYADPDSPGGRLKAARPGDMVQLDQDLPSQPLRATVQEFDFSAHAPREALLEYIKRTTPKKVVLVHGDPPAIAWFEQAINKYLPKTEVIVPLPGKEYEL